MASNLAAILRQDIRDTICPSIWLIKQQNKCIFPLPESDVAMLEKEEDRVKILSTQSCFNYRNALYPLELKQLLFLLL